MLMLHFRLQSFLAEILLKSRKNKAKQNFWIFPVSKVHFTYKMSENGQICSFGFSKNYRTETVFVSVSVSVVHYYALIGISWQKLPVLGSPEIFFKYLLFYDIIGTFCVVLCAMKKYQKTRKAVPLIFIFNIFWQQD